MSFHVHLSSQSMFDVLQMIGTLHLTGRATVVAKSKVARLTLLRGRLLEASVDGVERVGERLVRERVISAADLNAVLRRQSQPGFEAGYPVGILVTMMGLSDNRQVRPIVFGQLSAACREILRWDEGTVDVTPDESILKLDSRNPQLDLSGLLLEIAHLRDVEARMHRGTSTAAVEDPQGLGRLDEVQELDGDASPDEDALEPARSDVERLAEGLDAEELDAEELDAEILDVEAEPEPSDDEDPASISEPGSSPSDPIMIESDPDESVAERQA
ncbi:MAG: DUF4388 domain-containing protein [Planctomycetes bacterium]|nr:DUF4388 domain-containing protein [Planctomycetota bacterium]